MKNKTMKKAMITSIIALALCFAMLLGTTYAWFTDSVASSGNIIKSGTLNIDLLIKTGTDADYVSVKENPTKKAFDYDKWEPGYTEWVNAKVATTGNLALKYTMKIVANGVVSALADVIDVYYASSEVAKPADRNLTGLTKIGTLADALAGTIVINDELIPGTNEEDFATLALHMQETAGNEYQDLSIGTDFSLQILATQYTYEEDSFDDKYDADAEFPNVARVNDAAALTAAIADPEITEIKLENDVAIPAASFSAVNKEFDLGGKTLTINDTNSTEIKNGANVVFKNGNIVANEFTKGTNSAIVTERDSSLTLDNVTMTTTGTAIYPRGDTATVNVKNSTITAGCYAIGTNANTADHYGVVITLEDSTFSTNGYQNNDGDAATVMINVAGTLNVKNCVINGHRQALLVRAGDATVEGTMINYDGNCSAVASRDAGNWGSGNEVYGAAIVVGNKNPNNQYRANANLALNNVTINNTSAERASLAVFGNDTYAGHATYDTATTGIGTPVLGNEYGSVN